MDQGPLKAGLLLPAHSRGKKCKPALLKAATSTRGEYPHAEN